MLRARSLPMSLVVMGTTRSLTAGFRRHRDDARRSRTLGADMETAALLNSALGGSGHDGDIELASASIMAPVWMQKSEKIRGHLSILREHLTKLKEAHSRALLVTFGDSGMDVRAQADALTRELQDGFKQVNKEINVMEAATPGADDFEVRKQVRQQLARALMALTQEFRREETRFLNKVEAQKGLAAGSTLGLVDTDSPSLDGFDPGFNQAQTTAVDTSLLLAEQRDKDIQSIVETITELAQIMHDLGALVVEQGTMLDRIDHSIQETAVRIEQGVRHIQAADKKQKASRLCVCIMALVVLIVLTVIFVIAKAMLYAAPAFG